MSRLDRGEGSMGKLMRDEDLYRELTGTLNETRALIGDIKADPKKYFKVSVF
jgi:phospholipid/cholesterol/gamma-HCH transport system substrate-binding protein